jgi:hypothetical protein
MPDLQTPPSENSQPTPAADAPDPLAHLHKMSTTAGLGTTEYVAINGTSVVAVILGLASALAIVDKILLIVPIAGVVCASVALYQIAKSGGTQTGRGLAILGLLLSFGFAGYVGYLSIAKAHQETADRATLETVIAELSGDIKTGDFEKAYALFSPRFQERVPLARFKEVMGYVKSHPNYGNLKGLATNGRYAFESDENTGSRYAQVILLMDLDKFSEPSRQDATFRVVGGQWKVENIPGLFPAQGAGQGG